MVRGIRTAGILAIATSLVACASPTGHAGSATNVPPPAAKPSSTPSTPSTEASAGAGTGTVRRALARMSTEEKVGQLFMPVVHGTSAAGASAGNQNAFGASTPAQVIAKYHLGGVILFPENIKSVSQVVSFTNGLQKASKGVPLIIGTDQENGLVSRMSALVTDLPGASVIGATRDTGLARKAAEATGAELKALGVNLDFAPVADVNIDPRNPVIGKRAFGDNPARVAQMVAASVKGFHDAGVAATAKHFPGHGDTRTDSHTGLPVIKHTRAQWEAMDAPPFKSAIGARVDAIMSAHIVMPKLDSSGDPATLSKPILTGLLRDKLGFDGVISTDALNMEGVRKKYDDGEVAVRAILAGADLLLMPPNLPKAHSAVLAAVKSGRISRERLDQSVTRLLELREKRGFLETAPVASAAAAAKVLRSAEHRRLAAMIESQSR
ncbi:MULTISPECIES: beta-N-acetylhexosaminidase [Nonomuraea]|uniref:beta-N-acetylhexosaminidase n=1 Tax=Nonomuraea mangrovi TaxID=2316207 RepID=A0ABW4STM6_9ACTN